MIDRSAGYTLITGASAGIGRAIAGKFAARGHNLILVARRIDLLEAIKAELERNHEIEVLVFEADLAANNAGAALYERLSEFDVRTMINNAGFGDFDFAWDMDLEKADRMLALNVEALTQLSLRFTRDNRERKATLINVASTGGYSVYRTAVTYCATKFFVSSLTEGIAHELAMENKPMRAKVLAPAGTATDFFDKANDQVAGSADTSRYIAPEGLADYAYQLFESESVVGIVDPATQTLSLRDPIFNFV